VLLKDWTFGSILSNISLEKARLAPGSGLAVQFYR
jgi:hypothetical protein